ncbi:MAG: threonine aldolase [Pseudopedobacter saltans]|uniref:Threonine aldolase n=1 Tax=Pseudopedobacter saltans TaxID=151895 RepID=A0A2W5F6Z9_9SPHI|nr:MAG: threonine aldolase [Pseudopedobacter saltans]
MTNFKNDYSEGCHPSILETIIASNMEQEEGYGMDKYSKEARKIIANKTGVTEEQVYFIPVGTQTNLLALSAILKPYEYAIAAESGHIVYVEAGAIEATGHKIIHLSTQVDGKVRIDDLEVFFGKMADIHNELLPRLLYISNTTEVGGVYSKEEIVALSAYCKEKGLLLYLDGARLASAMAASSLTFQDLGQYTDAFYIGATKAGGMMGEALVLVNPQLNKGFSIIQKQKGATLAKGRFLGIQFLELLKGNLYVDLAKHANAMATKIVHAMNAAGFEFMAEPQSNQLFPILPNLVIEKLAKKYEFYNWKKIDQDFTAIRLITSWATKEENVDAFILELKSLT